MKVRYLAIVGFFLILAQPAFSQDTEDIILGSSEDRFPPGLYDFSDPGAVNIKVSVWGYVGRAGKYIVPDYISVADLISYAGGPNTESELDDLRIYRTLENGKEQLIKFSYNDLMWEDELETRNRILPSLEPGDILIVPGSPRLFFTDWFRLGLSIFSILLSVASVVILLNRY